MKPTFHHRLINGPFEDPALYVRLLWQKRALLFDAGDISRLGQGDFLKLSDIFITHTHIDHFIGFDTILRALLRSEQPLRLFGPTGIIDCIEGKLRGYTWNLIKEYPLKLDVYAIEGATLKHAGFYAPNSFKREDLPEQPFSGIALRDAAFSVRAVSLMHDIECMAYCLEEDFHINIDKAALAGMGLPVGPWLSELKQAIREGSDREFTVDGRTYGMGDLKGIVKITKGQKVSYLADCAPTEDNIQKAIELVRDSDTLYCEAYFLDADRERALQRNHLTARLAGSIAREAGVRELLLMHFSPKYRSTPDAPIEEALREFRGE